MAYSKKGSLNLSINAIVVLILAITMLGLGLTFITKIFGQATGGLGDAFEGIDKQRVEKLENTCDQEVCLEKSKIELQKGKETDLYILFNNALSSDVTFDLTGTVDCHELGTGAPDQCGINDADSVVNMRVDTSVLVKKGGQRALPIYFEAKPSATKGTYIFNLDITQSDMAYDTIESVTVNVNI
ncbi:hypothetical protein K9M79_00510 [Candidatus Woesearchaeota archaeon]|nr:hypothetical protein [Candidatus Woesearchaeota archaeon]